MRADEFSDSLGKNSRHLAIVAEKQRAIEMRMAEVCKEQEQLVEDLAAVGVQVKSAWELLSDKAAYPAALPVLLAHLARPYSSASKESIVRALNVPESAPYWSVLLSIYERESSTLPSNVVDALAFALADLAIVRRDKDDEIIRLLSDTRLGESRVCLLRAVAFSKNRGVRTKLTDYTTDPLLGLLARKYLKRRKPASSTGDEGE